MKKTNQEQSAENINLNIKSKKVMDKIITNFQKQYQRKIENCKIENNSSYHDFCQACVNQSDRMLYFYFLLSTSDLWLRLEDQELIKAIIKTIFANNNFLSSSYTYENNEISYCETDPYILYKIYLDELSNPSRNIDISWVRYYLSCNVLSQMLSWTYLPSSNSQELFNKVLRYQELGKFLVCAFGEGAYSKNSFFPLTQLKTILSYAYIHANIVKAIYEPFIDNLASASIEDGEKVDAAYVKALEESKVVSPAFMHLESKPQEKDALKLENAPKDEDSKPSVTFTEDDHLNIKSKSKMDKLITEFKAVYFDGPADYKIASNSYFHEFCQICVSQSDQIPYFYFLLSTSDLWWKLEDQELIKDIIKTIIINDGFLASSYTYESHEISYNSNEPYIFYKIYLDELSNPSENIDIHTIRDYLFHYLLENMALPRTLSNNYRELLNKLLQNHELGQFLVCACSGERFSKYITLPLKEQLKIMLSYSYDHGDMVKTLYEPFIDTLASASIEDGKRVDAALAKYLEECNAKSPSFDSLDIKPKNLKPLD